MFVITLAKEARAEILSPICALIELMANRAGYCAFSRACETMEP
jgi:hypothetical protein